MAGHQHGRQGGADGATGRSQGDHGLQQQARRRPAPQADRRARQRRPGRTPPDRGRWTASAGRWASERRTAGRRRARQPGRERGQSRRSRGMRQNRIPPARPRAGGNSGTTTETRNLHRIRPIMASGARKSLNTKGSETDRKARVGPRNGATGRARPQARPARTGAASPGTAPPPARPAQARSTGASAATATRAAALVGASPGAGPPVGPARRPRPCNRKSSRTGAGRRPAPAKPQPLAERTQTGPDETATNGVAPARRQPGPRRA